MKITRSHASAASKQHIVCKCECAGACTQCGWYCINVHYYHILRSHRAHSAAAHISTRCNFYYSLCFWVLFTIWKMFARTLTHSVCGSVELSAIHSAHCTGIRARSFSVLRHFLHIRFRFEPGGNWTKLIFYCFRRCSGASYQWNHLRTIKIFANVQPEAN